MLAAELQWGSVAEWVGAISELVGALGTAGALIIALLILLRDRANAERAQVNLVGAWGEPTYERGRPGEPRVEMAEIRICVRNGSQLPVVVKRLAFSLHTKWVTQVRSYYVVTERGPMACYFLPYFRVPADYTWETSLLVKLPAPADALQLDPTQGVHCEINSVQLIDNIGDEWDIRPSNGGRAQRMNEPRLI